MNHFSRRLVGALALSALLAPAAFAQSAVPTTCSGARWQRACPR
jgi:hypothetical protein